MSAKVHLHLHVSDLTKSRQFYEKFLGSGPVKVKDGYVKFLPSWAPAHLALSTGGPGGARRDPRVSAGGPRRGGTLGHVGVQVESVGTVMAELARVKGAGLDVV